MVQELSDEPLVGRAPFSVGVGAWNDARCVDLLGKRSQLVERLGRLPTVLLEQGFVVIENERLDLGWDAVELAVCHTEIQRSLGEAVVPSKLVHVVVKGSELSRKSKLHRKRRARSADD